MWWRYWQKTLDREMKDMMSRKSRTAIAATAPS